MLDFSRTNCLDFSRTNCTVAFPNCMRFRMGNANILRS
jgi:hypothetical protein